MCTRVRRGCVIQRCQNKKSQIEIRTRGCKWRHAPGAWAEDLGIWEKAVSWVPASERERRDLELGVAKRIFCVYGRRALVGLRADDVKAVSIEILCVSLSLCRMTFNLKVIKFRIWTNCVFSDSIVCLWTFYEHYVYFIYLYHVYITLRSARKFRISATIRL